MSGLDPPLQALVDFVTADYLTRDSFTPVRGQIVRASMAGSHASKQAQLDALCLRHAVRYGEPPDEDAYAPTPEGALASSTGPDVRLVLATLYATLKTKQSRDPGFRALSYNELSRDLTFRVTPARPDNFVDRILTVFGVGATVAPFDGSRAWERPSRTEELVELPDADTFIDVLSARTRTRKEGRDAAPARRVRAEAGEFDGLVPAALRERLKVVEHISDGSFASVYLVVDRNSWQRFALKVTRPAPDALARARREVEATRTLTHENILATIAVDPDGEWFLLPLAEGTLGQIHSWGGLSPLIAHDIAACACEALAYAHEKGFLHRDLHPDNILRHDGAWKIADWGLTIARDSQRMTRTRSVGGGQTWTAPEQIESLGNADERSDLFSVGRIVQWLVTGLLPDPTHPGALPPEEPLAGFVNAATKLERDDRPRSVRAALALVRRHHGRADDGAT